MTEISTFAGITDSKSIVRFVRDIERHPCLYNPKSFQYVDRELKRKTWINIAKRLNATVAECKEKWRKIRTAYSRSLKPKYLDGVRIPSRPYYLASYLKFITPVDKRNLTTRKHFISASKNKPPSNSVTKDIKKEIKPKAENPKGRIVRVKSSDSEDELDIQDGNPNDPNEEMFLDENSLDGYREDQIISKHDTVLVNTKSVINKTKAKEVRNKNKYSSGRIRKRCNYCVNIESKPRKMFLFSILPDIDALTDQQMRCFRRELIDLIDKYKCLDA